MRNSYKAPLQSQDAGATLYKLYSIKGINHQAFEFIGGSSMVRVKSVQNSSAWSMSRVRLWEKRLYRAAGKSKTDTHTTLQIQHLNSNGLVD